LDATHNYMYVFLLAGCQVVLSAFIICLGNFFCLKKKLDEGEEEEPGARLEMAEREELKHLTEVGSEDGPVAAQNGGGDGGKSVGKQENMAKGLAGEMDEEVKPEKGV